MDEFDPGHTDRVTVLHINFTSTRILTASADHRIKVWERDPDSGQQTLTDTWTAHDADIRDAKWLHPTTGSNIVSIGNDLKFKLWTEDLTQPPNSGRRFRCICTISSSTKVPFVSLDIKKQESVYTFLALIDRCGLLSVFEPTSFDSLRDWSLLDQWNICSPNPPDRGAETSFKVRFDQNIASTPYMNSLTDDAKMLSIVATAMDTVKIYRSTITQETSSQLPGALPTETQKTTFFEAARLPTHPALIRDVQWAPFNIRGYDLFATASRDGGVRVYRMDTAASATSNTSQQVKAALTAPGSSTPFSGANQVSSQAASSNIVNRPGPQSSLTSAIAGRQAAATGPGLNAFSTSRTQPRTSFPLPFTHTISVESEILNAHRDAWAVCWDPAGQVLMSSGSDGITKLWKKTINGLGWMLFADQEVNVESDDDDGVDGEKHDG